ncbi:MAG: hypothetical protein LH660_19550 [Phormidesmis sp. CAN_BIN36]|nr:hypothetical protein [Phormidesmis sp. CAN_BIN36]
MTQSNDLSQRVDRTEGQIVDLQLTANLILQAISKNSEDIAVLIEVSRRNTDGIAALQEGRQAIAKNSEDIAVLIEVSRRNSEGIAALQDGTAALQMSQLRTEAALQVFQQHTDASIERLNASIERIDASIERIDASIERLTANDERTEQLLEYLIRRDRG